MFQRTHPALTSRRSGRSGQVPPLVRAPVVSPPPSEPVGTLYKAPHISGESCFCWPFVSRSLARSSLF